MVIYKSISITYCLYTHSFKVVELCNLPNVWNLVFHHYLSQTVLLLHLPAMLQNVVSNQVQLLAAPLPLPFQCCFPHPWCISNRTLNPLLVHLQSIIIQYVERTNNLMDTLLSTVAVQAVMLSIDVTRGAFISTISGQLPGMHSFLLTLLCNMLYVSY